MKSFLQSDNWLEFQKLLNRKIWRIEGVGIIKYNLPFKKGYLYASRLRPSDFGGQARLKGFLDDVRKLAKQENAIFLKIEPVEEIDEIKFKNFGFKESHNVQPIKTIILDIAKSEQELLSEMHYKTRYNIQLAQKKNIEIKRGKQYFDDFWGLTEQTVKRDGFRSYPKEYYRKMLEIPGVELFVAEFNNKIIVANIVVFYEKTCIYLHGASDYEHRNLMAPYLLQWEQIKEAKKRGCIEYDFWGINEKKWPGVTRFKRGFSGREISYPGAYDLIFQPFWYLLYKIARKII